MLGLAEAEAVREALEKRDYGEFVHRILLRFHAAHPQLTRAGGRGAGGRPGSDQPEVFAPEIEENFLEHAWLARWLDRVPGYVAWQKAREAAGWRHVGGELARQIVLPLADAGRGDAAGPARPPGPPCGRQRGGARLQDARTRRG
jgi:ATP-dependent helicase/nuclease subunit B